MLIYHSTHFRFSYVREKGLELAVVLTANQKHATSIL